MNLPDGPGYSPDGGKFCVKDGVLYWHDGTFRKLDGSWMVRTMPMNHGQDYSAFSDEERAALVKKWTDQRIEYENKQRKEYEAREVLRASARLKLTEDEYNAVEYDE